MALRHLSYYTVVMKWKTAKKLTDSQFKRMFGVQRETFQEMVSTAKKNQVKSSHKIKGKKRGPKSKLTWYDKVLMLLMYYRNTERLLIQEVVME